MQSKGLRYVVAIISIALTTAILEPFQARLSSITVALALLLMILFTATFIGRNPALLAFVVATLCFNYFFLPPVRTWTISDSQNWSRGRPLASPPSQPASFPLMHGGTRKKPNAANRKSSDYIENCRRPLPKPVRLKLTPKRAIEIGLAGCSHARHSHTAHFDQSRCDFAA